VSLLLLQSQGLLCLLTPATNSSLALTCCMSSPGVDHMIAGSTVLSATRHTMKPVVPPLPRSVEPFPHLLHVQSSCPHVCADQHSAVALTELAHDGLTLLEHMHNRSKQNRYFQLKM
jgi:hypothetical protein